MLQSAPGAQSKVQPPPEHEFEQCELAVHVKVQPPPGHEFVQCAPASQLIAQPPPSHVAVQTAPGWHSQSHEPVMQSRVQAVSQEQEVPLWTPQGGNVVTGASVVEVEESVGGEVEESPDGGCDESPDEVEASAEPESS